MRIPEPNFVPDDDTRDPLPEEEQILEILETSDLEPSQIDQVMAIIASLVDEVIRERDKECPVCIKAALSHKEENEDMFSKQAYIEFCANDKSPNKAVKGLKKQKEMLLSLYDNHSQLTFGPILLTEKPHPDIQWRAEQTVTGQLNPKKG